MGNVLLAEFIDRHRDAILSRIKATSRLGRAGTLTEHTLQRGIPLFMEQIIDELGAERTTAIAMRASATQHGRDRFADGFSVAQLVHDYGDLCQSITSLAVETDSTISAGDFQTLNRCLDNAIADAISSFTHQVRTAKDGEALQLRNLVYLIVEGFGALREGKVAVNGATGDSLHRSLLALSDLVDHRPS
jgi:hypothetical protein